MPVDDDVERRRNRGELVVEVEQNTHRSSLWIGRHVEHVPA